MSLRTPPSSKTARFPLGATVVLVSAALVLLALAFSADAGRVPLVGARLQTVETRSTLNDFDAGSTDGGCTLATGIVPEGTVFVIYDVVCTATSRTLPLESDETFVVSVIDGAACSGRTPFRTTFGSREGLRYSPELPFYAGPDMSVRVARAASLNDALVQVSCIFRGVYQRAPES
jgi:hypothetical protein